MPTSYCFDITTAKAFYEKLLRPAFEEFKKDMLSSTKALTCAIFLWQFAEWVFHSHRGLIATIVPTNPTTIHDLRTYIASLNEGYGYVGKIATGAKHFDVTSAHMKGVKRTEVLH